MGPAPCNRSRNAVRVFLMGVTWFRQRLEADTDDPIGACRKQRKTEVTANDSNFLMAANG